MAYQPKSYRKFVATAATATLVATAVTPAFAAETGAAATFSDVAPNYKTAVDYLVNNKITLGVTDTQFGTEQAIKRVDAAVMIAKALEVDITDRPDSGFSDVPARAKAYVDALKADGIINGKTATSFGSDQDITRGEIALILTNAYKLTGTSDKEFSDVAGRYVTAVDALVANGITQGKTATQFGTADAIKRGEFAIFLYRAENLGKTLVEAVSATASNDSATVTATVKNATANATAKVEIFANGNTSVAPAATQTVNVVDGKVTANFSGLPAGSHIAKVTVGEASAQAGFTVQIAQPKVESVTAINASTVKVTFNKALNKDAATAPGNYELKLNGSTTATAVTPVLQDDKKTVLLTGVNFTNGDYFKLTVKNMLSEDLQKLATYTTEIVPFFDSAAPTVTGAELKGGNVRVYFNEPVTGVQLKVDGNPLSAAQASTSTTDGRYYVEVAATTATSSVGTHNVTAYNATDAQGNKTDIANVSYTVVNETVAPAVTSVKADTQDSFYVTFSKELAATPTFEVKKGALEFTETITQDLEKDPTGKTYKVTVPAADTTGQYKLYGTNENTVSLSLKVTGIRDAANLAGADYSSAVSLTKDAAAPKVLSSNLNTATASAISIKFDENISVVDASKVKLYKDGVRQNIAATDVSVAGDTLSIAGSFSEGTYTVQLDAGAVQDAAENKNAALSTTATLSADSFVTVDPSAVTVNGNVFTITYPGTVDMTSSAASLSNYTLDGRSFPTGSTIEFVGNKRTVQITIPNETLSKDAQALIGISKDVKNVNGQSVALDTEGTAFTSLVDVYDNVKPVLASGKFTNVNSSTNLTNTVELTFSESVEGTNASADDFQFMVNGAEVAGTVALNGTDKAVVTFAQPVNVNQALTVKVLAEADQDDKAMGTTDASTAANELTAGTTITVAR
ncbi:S-layer homology domain-containing protein [Domibacillus sp.]|uniref:S-layer homology domain-containing protein n=1 Tax=Domibacillus sp. TaxID=1969783 RepID=UPI002810DCD8|nr:S-layer homology domain-containing protein [Domibacillus sp.]